MLYGAWLVNVVWSRRQGVSEKEPEQFDSFLLLPLFGLRHFIIRLQLLPRRRNMFGKIKQSAIANNEYFRTCFL